MTELTGSNQYICETVESIEWHRVPMTELIGSNQYTCETVRALDGLSCQ